MNKRILLAPLPILLICILLVGCNLPINLTPTPFVFPTPNLTMTAIFNLPVSVPPTVTPLTNQSSEGQPLVISSQLPQKPTVTSASQLPAASTPTPILTPTAGTPQPAKAAAYLSTPPTIDGNWAEWTTTQYPVSWVVFGKDKWNGSKDLGGAYRIGWDNTYLYLAVKITDDVYSQLETGTNIYKGDSIELLFNTNPSTASSTQGLTESDYQIGISPGNPAPGKNPEAFLWFPTDKTGSLTDVKIGAQAMTGGYRIEAAIPWTTFGVTPASGQQYGFAVSISDDDQPNTAVQEKMISSAPKRNLVDPTTWGVLSLVQ